MRKQLHTSHPLTPYFASKLVPGLPKSDFTAATVNIENEVIKKKHPDNIDVPAVVVREASDRLTFVVEPTRRDLLQTNFKLDTSSHLKIRYRGNIFQSEEISFSQVPIHPIIHTSFLMKDSDRVVPIAGFNEKSNEYWKHAALTPHENALCLGVPLLDTIRDTNGYSEMVLDNPHMINHRVHERPVYAKYLKDCKYNGQVMEQYVLLETSSYFEHLQFSIEEGCILKDDMQAFECLDVTCLYYPYHPILTVRPIEYPKSA